MEHNIQPLTSEWKNRPPGSLDPSSAVLLTGATGYIGTLICSALLGYEACSIVALVRSGPSVETFRDRVMRELAAMGRHLSREELDQRLILIPLPPAHCLDTLIPELRRLRVTEIVHCAGCLDYYNTVELERINIAFTQQMLYLTERLTLDRFTYISTAYSSGYVNGVVRERLHAEDTSDPNDYIRTKRLAERCIAASGLPYLILRPSIVIGHSRTGRYSGKRYGLYQQWIGAERLLYDRLHTEMHVVAPQMPLNFVHQDAFQAGFLHALKTLPPGNVLHLTSAPEIAPTSRELWGIWFDAVGRPSRVHYYDRLDEVPLKRIHPRQRAFLMLASGNLEIAAHPWRFETDGLERLQRQGLEFPHASLESIAVCQRQFLETSQRMQGFVRNLG